MKLTFLLIGLSIASPAAAQVAGTYSGTSADGSGITFVVSTDASTGNLALTSASIGYSAPCKGESFTSTGGWGFGLTSDIVKGRVTSNTYNSFFDFFVKLSFSRDGQSATGTIATIVPTLYTTTAKATRALFCEAPTQALSLTLQPATAAAKPSGNASYIYDRKGRIIGQITR
jgi:hypothetical protein